MIAEVRLGPGAAKLARKGHPWFFADDLEQAPVGDADLVRVLDHEGRPQQPGRADSVVARRAQQRGPHRGTRLVHGEADGLPGLVVDEYDRCLVVQVTTAPVERSLDCIVSELVQLTGAECVVARHDAQVRKHEGLPLEVRLLHGRRVERVTIEEHGVRHPVRLLEGHKTGFYLDQRPARARVMDLARGRRLLDLFCYQGGFSLAALCGGAAAALAVDQSEASLALAREAAALNGVAAGLDTRAGNAFDVLRELRAGGAAFDLIVLDPPAFAKSRREVQGALRGYRDLNRQALRLLAPGGVLLTCSCSHHLSRSMFEDVLRQAAADLPFRVFLRERLTAGSDHPVWISLPESEYLKVCVLERDSSAAAAVARPRSVEEPSSPAPP